jgi:hypothetical protein
MRGCIQITDAAFEHLTGIHTLTMSGCKDITDAAFVHLAGIHILNMGGCKGITDAALVHLRGIQLLNMGGCTGIREGGLAELGCSLEVLDVTQCRSSCIEAANRLYGVTERNPEVKRLPASCGGGARGGYTRTKKQKRKVSTRKR